jgi:hypothetical protein
MVTVSTWSIGASDNARENRSQRKQLQIVQGFSQLKLVNAQAKFMHVKQLVNSASPLTPRLSQVKLGMCEHG